MTTAEMATGSFERSMEQRMRALANANRIRFYRAGVKRDVRAGRVDALALLREPPEELLAMKVFDLLLAVPGQGRVRVNRALVRAHVSPSKTLGGLSERQRGELRLLILGGRNVPFSARVAG